MDNKKNSELKITDIDIVSNEALSHRTRDRSGPVVNTSRDRSGPVVNTSRDRSGPVVNTSKGKKEDDDVVILNVGGMRHETRIATLLKKPETRLYSVGETAKATGKKEFYFDRNPQIFPCILNYYRIDKLHMPMDVCGPAAKAELDYWELEDKDIAECCWVNYISYEDTLAMLESFQTDERNQEPPVCFSEEASFIANIRPRLWRAIEDPYSSKAAMIFAVYSLITVLASITVFVLETLPYFGSVFARTSEASKNITSEEIRHELDIFSDISPHNTILLIDNACNAYFFFEFIVKLIASPQKWAFIKRPLVIIELVCLLPFYIGILIIELHPDPASIFLLIRVLFATRGLRIFRIFMVIKHFLALKILFYTIRASTKELFLLLIVLLMGVVIFACIIYYMEVFSEVEDLELTNIPLAFWWAVVTMTTVGYGDLVPKSILGYVVGSFCALCGVLVIALSVPVIVNNFTIYYTHAQSKEKLKLRKKKFEQTEKWQKLKSGPESKLKSASLNGVLSAKKKKNTVTPVETNPKPEMSFNKRSEGKDMSSSKFQNKPVPENDGNDPSLSRDVILLDVSVHVRGASPARKDDVVVTENTSEESKNIGNMSAGQHKDDGKTNTSTRGGIQSNRNVVRSDIFGGKRKLPGYVRRIKSVKTKADKDLDQRFAPYKSVKKKTRDSKYRVSHA